MLAASTCQPKKRKDITDKWGIVACAKTKRVKISINVRAGKLDGPRKKSNGPNGLEARFVVVMERVLSTEPNFRVGASKIQNPPFKNLGLCLISLDCFFCLAPGAFGAWILPRIDSWFGIFIGPDHETPWFDSWKGWNFWMLDFCRKHFRGSLSALWTSTWQEVEIKLTS